MTIKEIDNKDSWNNYLLLLHPNTFLQSWEWGQVQRHSGEGIQYLGMFENETQVGAALVLTVNARRGRHLFIPHGPLSKNEQTTRNCLPALIDYCRAKARDVRAGALRIAPLLLTTPENTTFFKQLGFRPAPLHVHTELTWVLDINKSEEELRAGMRKTTRHAIKKAQQAGITIDIQRDPAALERFFPLYTTTKHRHDFTPFSQSFLREQVQQFAQDNRVYLCFAQHEGKDLAGAIIVHFGTTAFYHHGASRKIPSHLPASQLLQWESIREAKRRGATRYNFWGIAPDNQPNHPFAGITTFKKGFGGYALDYMHAQDLPLSPSYTTLWLVDTYRKWKRGF